MLNLKQNLQMAPVSFSKACKIAILNSKGGCGKTTITTNLASIFANLSKNVSIIDFDPQHSSLQWSQSRPTNKPFIYTIGIKSNPYSKMTVTWQLSVPVQTEYIIMDSPAGVTGNDLNAILEKADRIIIPVVPSEIDIKATKAFIEQLSINPIFRFKKIPTCVSANRVNNPMIFQKLQHFLHNLKIPFINTFQQHDSYILASELGLGILEYPYIEDQVFFEHEMVEWEQLINWIETYD